MSPNKRTPLKPLSAYHFYGLGNSKKIKHSFWSFLVLLIFLTLDLQAQNTEAYTQYLLDFSTERRKFEQHLRAANPSITKDQLKAELKQFYRNNFKPPRPATRPSSLTGSGREKIDNKNGNQVSSATATSFNQVSDDQEYQALRELFDNTDGPNWSNLTGWDYPNWKNPSVVTFQDFENWYGVTVLNGDVVELNLGFNNLNGTIPSSITDLQSLRYLDISYNSFNAPVLNILTGLSKLEFLDISSSAVTGTLPINIGDMVSLQHFRSYFNESLEGSIPPSFSNLGNLRFFEIGGSLLSGSLPVNIGLNHSLERIDLWGNNLSGNLPESICDLSSLKYIDLGFNDFSGKIPRNIGNLDSLVTISMYYNRFDGDLPPSMGLLNSLKFLDFYENQLSAMHPSIRSLNLEYGEISSNYFDFGELEKLFDSSGNLSSPIYYEFQYTSLPTWLSIDFVVGDTVSLPFAPPGEQNIFQWQKWNGASFTDYGPETRVGVDQNPGYLKIEGIQFADAGRYRCKVINAWATGLELFSNEITINVSESPINVVCAGQPITLTVDGMGTINWYNEVGSVPIHTGPTFTTSALDSTTTYYVTLTTRETETEAVPIMAYVGPIFNITSNTEICLGESLPIVIEGNSLTVDWGSEIGALNSFVAQPDTTTTYSYTIEDAFGCSASGQVTITVNDPVDSEILPTVPVCPGQTATLEAVEVTGATYAWEPGGLSGRTVDVVINELQEYTLTVTSANGCSAQASILPEIQTIAVASEDREICVVDTVTLVAEGGDSYVWSTGDTIPEINFSRTIPGIYTLTVTATKDGCSASDDVVVTVNAFCPGTPISFMARAISTTEIELNWQEPPGNHTEYVIQRRNAAAVYETVATLPVGTTAWPDSGLQPGTVYFYRIYSQAGTAQSEMRFARARTFTPNQNYVMETEVLTESITDVAFVPNLNYHQRNSTWNYLNGLGSDMQTVVEGASPSEKDVVQPIIYDEYGIRSKQYLSYTIAQTTEPGNFRDDAEQETTDFYANPPTGIASTSFPYAETVFDTSPQNKVLEQGSTGEAWQVSTGNTIKIDRTTNAASDVLHWKISGIQLEAQGYYPAAQLKKTITVNEDDETVLLYEDMLGRELMRKVERAAGDIITYFVYNNRGSLLYRITPNVISGFTGLPPFTIDQNTLLTQCYSYRYDAQEKLIEEKWPDQEAIYYVYDQWDRLVLSQSGNQRQNNQWTFTKYDRFDRPVLTGLLDNADFTRSAMQSAIDNYYATGGRRYEAYEGVNGAVHGYTNDSYPVLADEQAYLSVTYYDSYDFIQSDTLFGAAYAYDSSMLGCQDSPQGEYCFPAAPLKILRGKVTGSKTKVLNQDQWLPGVVYYDDDGRTIQAIAQNHTGGIDRASTLHNFAGWPLMTYSTLNMPGTDNYAIQRKFVYDHAGRLKEGYHELFKNDVGQGEKFLAENVYNELGQLIEKNLHVEQDIPLQSVDYQYNIRGWLQSINNVQFSVDGRNNDINDLFGMEILYQNPLNGVQPGGN